MARIDLPPPEAMTPAQREVHDAIVAGPRGRIEGPFEVWLARPELCAPAQALGRVCRFDNLLPADLKEIAICTVGRWWRAEYEWWAHKRFALEAGVPEAILDAIRDGTPPPFRSEAEAVVHAVALALLREGRLSDALYARAEAAIGTETLVDLVAVVGYYCMVSFTLNAFEVDLPEGERAELP